MAILNELTQLSKMENSKVALRARQVTFTHHYHLNPFQLRRFSLQRSHLFTCMNSIQFVNLSGLDRFPFTILWAEAQSGGIHLPVRHRHVRTPVLSGELEGLWKNGLWCVFSTSWDANQCGNVLFSSQKLILSETSIFDVLPNFFYHVNQVVCMAALEVWAFRDHLESFRVFLSDDPPAFDPQVYVRRAYIAYELNSIQHHRLQDGTCAVDFQFMLPSSHPNR